MEARGDTETCAICLETMMNDVTVKVLLDPCFHMFHSRCLFTCLYHSISSVQVFKCPTCRTIMINIVSAENSNPQNLFWSEAHWDRKLSYRMPTYQQTSKNSFGIPSLLGWIMSGLICFHVLSHSLFNFMWKKLSTSGVNKLKKLYSFLSYLRYYHLGTTNCIYFILVSQLLVILLVCICSWFYLP